MIELLSYEEFLDKINVSFFFCFGERCIKGLINKYWGGEWV